MPQANNTAVNNILTLRCILQLKLLRLTFYCPMNSECSSKWKKIYFHSDFVIISPYNYDHKPNNAWYSLTTFL